MRSDPEPHEPIVDFDGERSVMAADSDRPQSAHLLEMERRVSRVALEAFVGLVGDDPNVSRKRAVACPEVRRREVLQSRVVLPLA